MEHFDTIGRINELMSERNWTLYQLSKATGIPKSTLNRLMNHTNSPTVRTVELICHGLGITLQQFFQANPEDSLLTEEEQRCLTVWNGLIGNDREKALAYMKGLQSR